MLVITKNKNVNIIKLLNFNGVKSIMKLKVWKLWLLAGFFFLPLIVIHLIDKEYFLGFLGAQLPNQCIQFASQ